MINKSSKTINKSIYYLIMKRPIDLLLTFLALLILSPILILISFLVRIKLGKPVIFKQKRPGLNEQIFTLYKFRTMSDEKDENGELLPDSLRLTKFGKFLRSSSMDELPELFNIIMGDMSIVGPRPLSVKYLDYYTEFEKQRHFVNPGLTGLAQINGRNLLTWEKRFEFDVYYVNNVSFLLDLKIIIKTLLKVIKRSDLGTRGVDYPDNRSLDDIRNKIK